MTTPTDAGRDEAARRVADDAGDPRPRLLFAVHVDGACDGGPETPTFSQEYSLAAVAAAAALKRADADTLITIVVWPDDDDEGVRRTPDQVAAALADVREAAARWGGGS